MENTINEGHYAELLDRLHIVIDNIDSHLLEHPLAKQEQKIKKLIERATENLAEAYLTVGNLKK